MAETKQKGYIGEAKILSDLVRRGCKVLLPFGEDFPFDLVIYREKKFERVQCKYTKSDGKVIKVRCRSANNWIDVLYTPDDIDWLAVYDKTTETIAYIPSVELGENGRRAIHLRLTETQNRQSKKIRFAKDYANL